jgi:DNA-binding MurR/RpiR family transcriptional regulator
MNMDSLSRRIKDHFAELTRSEQKVAAFILDGRGQALLCNQEDIARQAGVSEATVSRFVRKLGFARFQELKAEIARQALDSFSTAKRLADSADELDRSVDAFSRVLHTDIENIQSLRETITASLFERAVDAICSARRILVLGLRSSHALAYYLAFDLRFFLHNVSLVTPGTEELPEQILDIQEEDVLVCISFRRYTRKTVEMAHMIRERGASIISITDSDLSPLGQMADLSLATPTRIPSFFESYTAPLCLMNALLTAIALRKEDEAIPVLNRLESVFEELNTYIG